MPAVERYDGPAFRLVRRLMREQPQLTPDIFVLSAKFGLLAKDHLIPSYDVQLTRETATMLRSAVECRLGEIAGQHRYGQVYLFGGPIYQDVLFGAARSLKDLPCPRAETGSIGVKLTALRTWLYGRAANSGQATDATAAAAGRATIRGITITMATNAVIEAARRWRAEDGSAALRHHAWYVNLDGERLSPKWLVARLTSLAVGSFHTDDARRVLQRLGVPVLNSFIEREDI